MVKYGRQAQHRVDRYTGVVREVCLQKSKHAGLQETDDDRSTCLTRSTLSFLALAVELGFLPLSQRAILRAFRLLPSARRIQRYIFVALAQPVLLAPD